MQQTHGNIYENVCSRKECAANERRRSDVKKWSEKNEVMRNIIFWNFWRQMWFRKKVRTLVRFIDYGWWCGK